MEKKDNCSQMAILNIAKYTIRGLNHSKEIDIGTSKSFDMLNHNSLRKKLAHYRICSVALE